MGLLDALFGKKDPPAEEIEATPESADASLAGRIRRLGLSDWDWTNDTARALAREVLTEAGASFDRPTVKEIPDDRETQLRAVHRGIPVLAGVSLGFGSLGSLSARCDNRVGVIDLRRDHDAKPKEPEPGDPWSADEDIRVFVAEGIFLEDHPRYLREDLEAWTSLPADARERLTAALERLDARRLACRDLGEGTAHLEVRPKLHELEDPVGYVRSCLETLAELGETLARGGVDPTAAPTLELGADGETRATGSPASETAFTPATCAYCGTLFLLTVGRHQCPNCGAPAQG
ncbi:MAG TPA: hypothetical protein RMH99_08120 [Sandaracinaceae bacterium LLY-WYZ-13_1]|nr:hypothetical protein [Sandaracinaceae bacterium LLY-WYZ-13_1]